MTSDPRIDGQARLMVADQRQLVNMDIGIQYLPNYMP